MQLRPEVFDRLLNPLTPLSLIHDSTLSQTVQKNSLGA